jgi:hypothetical protein
MRSGSFGRYVSYMRKFKHADRARRPVRTGCCFFKKKRKPPEPVVVGSKPTGPASPIIYNPDIDIQMMRMICFYPSELNAMKKKS